MTNLLKDFWHWFYTELPAYYSIPIIGLVISMFIGAAL
jgi:hypothetical protein